MRKLLLLSIIFLFMSCCNNCQRRYTKTMIVGGSSTMYVFPANDGHEYMSPYASPANQSENIQHYPGCVLCNKK